MDYAEKIDEIKTYMYKNYSSYLNLINDARIESYIKSLFDKYADDNRIHSDIINLFLLRQWSWALSSDKFSIEDMAKLVAYSIFSMCCAIFALVELKENDTTSIFNTNSVIRLSINEAALYGDGIFIISFPRHIVADAECVLEKFDLGWKSWPAEISCFIRTDGYGKTTTWKDIQIETMINNIKKVKGRWC